MCAPLKPVKHIISCVMVICIPPFSSKIINYFRTGVTSYLCLHSTESHPNVSFYTWKKQSISLS